MRIVTVTIGIFDRESGYTMRNEFTLEEIESLSVLYNTDRLDFLIDRMNRELDNKFKNGCDSGDNKTS